MWEAPVPWSIGKMSTLEWQNTKVTCSDTEGNTWLCKYLSPRKPTPKKLIDDIEKECYSLLGWNYMGEPL